MVLVLEGDGPVDGLAVDEGAVPAAEVLEGEGVLVKGEPAVLPGDAGVVGDLEGGGVAAADDGLSVRDIEFTGDLITFLKGELGHGAWLRLAVSECGRGRGKRRRRTGGARRRAETFTTGRKRRANHAGSTDTG